MMGEMQGWKGMRMTGMGVRVKDEKERMGGKNVDDGCGG